MVGFCLDDVPPLVGGAVVDQDDFVPDAAQAQFTAHLLDRGRDACVLITGQNGHRREL